MKKRSYEQMKLRVDHLLWHINGTGAHDETYQILVMIDEKLLELSSVKKFGTASLTKTIGWINNILSHKESVMRSGHIARKLKNVQKTILYTHQANYKILYLILNFSRVSVYSKIFNFSILNKIPQNRNRMVYTSN